MNWEPIEECRNGDGVMNWEPIRSQAALWGAIQCDPTGIHFAVGGSRSGKTSIGAAALAWVALNSAKRGDVLWAVGDSREACGEILWPQLAPLLGGDAASIRSSGRWPCEVQLSNGVTIQLFIPEDVAPQHARGLRAPRAIWSDEVWRRGAVAQYIMSAGLYIATGTPPDGWAFYSMNVGDNRVSRGGHLPDRSVDEWLGALRESENVPPREMAKRICGAYLGDLGP